MSGGNDMTWRTGGCHCGAVRFEVQLPASVLAQSCNCSICEKTGFICPFHGWRFNMNGDNTFVFGKQIFSEENLQKADLALVPCRVETWGGCAFINFDDDARP